MRISKSLRACLRVPVRWRVHACACSCLLACLRECVWMSAGVLACACMLARMRFYACALRFVHAVVFVRGACVRACLSTLLCRRACLRTHARAYAFPDRGAFSPWCAFAHAVHLPCPGKGRAGRRLQTGSEPALHHTSAALQTPSPSPPSPPLSTAAGIRRLRRPAGQVAGGAGAVVKAAA